MSEWSAISDLARIIAVLNARPDGLPIDAEYREPLSPMLPWGAGLPTHRDRRQIGAQVRVRSRINSCARLRGLPPAIIEMLAQITAHIRA